MSDEVEAKPTKKAMERFQEICGVVLGSPVNIGGKNFPERIEAVKYPGIIMSYDRLERQVSITWNGCVFEAPHFVGKFPGKNKWAGRVVQTDAPIAPVPQGKIQAQVSGPGLHVFAGPGAGLTGQE